MIITRTPLRLSLVGGNTDFPEYYLKYGGQVITGTIDKYVYCIVKERFDDQIWINYSKKEIVNNVRDIKHELVREVMKLIGIDKGIEITFLSDVPSLGSGLGSSSAVVIGLLNALHNFVGKPVSNHILAQEACYIELDVLKKPIGIQDQWAIALGGCNKIKFLKNGKVSSTSLNNHFNETFNNNLRLVYTNIQRKSEDILSKMKLDKIILDRNKELVNEGFRAITRHDSSLFADVLGKYWELKKKLNGHVTNKKINDLYNELISCGALGGKIVGAGGGGFILIVTPLDFILLPKYKELKFNFTPFGSQVIFNS